MESFKWDAFSDQPAVLPKEVKKELRRGHSLQYLKLFALNIPLYPFFMLKSLLLPKEGTIEKKDPKEIVGMCVNLDKGAKQVELIYELGIKYLQIRFFLHDIENIQKYVDFAKSFGKEKEILITLVQDRNYIQNLKKLQKDIKIVFEKFAPFCSEFQVGNAINRIKWGFVTPTEYLMFYKAIQDVRDKEFKEIKLIGSSVIDFEYHYTIYTLFNRYNIKYDKFSSLLYVDRRGSPYSKQMLFFDLKKKIDFLYEIVTASKKSEDTIYITEVNWPIENSAPYAPTSEKECVSLDLYAKYMIEYFTIAMQSKKIARVYWHQLIAPGYGLVDNRGGKIKKYQAFYDLKSFLKDGGGK